MPLTLEVVGQKAAQMGAALRKVFHAGGTIGRLRDNDWVFPDEYISGHHAKIIFANGKFLIEDTSTNGVFINSPHNRLARGQTYALQSGDTVYIDDYEVRVTLSAESSAGAGTAASGGYASFARAPLMPTDDPYIDVDQTMVTPNDTDPLRLLGLQDPPAVAPGRSAASLASNSPLSQHYQPPAASPPPAPPAPPPAKSAPVGSDLIPDDYDPFASDDALPLIQTVPPPAPPPVRTAPPPAATAPPPRRVAPAAQRPAAPPSSASPPSPAAAARAPSGTQVTSPPPPPRPAPGRMPIEPAKAATPARPAADAAPSTGNGRPAGTAPAAAAAAVAGGAPRPSAAPPGAGANMSPRPAAPAAQGPAGSSPEFSGERRVAAAAGNLDFTSLLEAAGIDAGRVTPELSAQFGQILRVVVAGVMDVLRSRGRIKDEFRMRTTTFKPADNNPLKFSANVEDALHNLLVKRNAAYLGPVEAFEDAFQDVRNHQMAMLAGMRVAYDAMLAEFEPQRLQEEFDGQLKSGSFLSGSPKTKYWELYRNRFHDMVKDADSSFRKLFGDEFAKAYEEQLVRLKTQNRGDRQ